MRIVTDCPFTVAEVVLIIALELLVGVVPLLPVLVELLLPQATAINATRSILIPRNARLNVSIGNILLPNENQKQFLNMYIRKKVTLKKPEAQITKPFAEVRGATRSRIVKGGSP